MRVVAKLKLQEKHDLLGGMKRVVFYPVCDGATPENARFQKYTPSGKVELCIDNPDVSFELGKEYYATFEVAE